MGDKFLLDDACDHLFMNIIENEEKNNEELPQDDLLDDGCDYLFVNIVENEETNNEELPQELPHDDDCVNVDDLMKDLGDQDVDSSEESDGGHTSHEAVTTTIYSQSDSNSDSDENKMYNKWSVTQALYTDTESSDTPIESSDTPSESGDSDVSAYKREHSSSSESDIVVSKT